MRKVMQHAKCHRVNDHGIHASILVTDGPRGSLGADVSHEACMDVLTQVGHQSNLSGTVIHVRYNNVSTCFRSRTSVLTVVRVDRSCPTPTTTGATGSRPMLSSILIPIAAKLGANMETTMFFGTWKHRAERGREDRHGGRRNGKTATGKWHF